MNCAVKFQMLFCSILSLMTDEENYNWHLHAFVDSSEMSLRHLPFRTFLLKEIFLSVILLLKDTTQVDRVKPKYFKMILEENDRRTCVKLFMRCFPSQHLETLSY